MVFEVAARCHKFSILSKKKSAKMQILLFF